MIYALTSGKIRARSLSYLVLYTRQSSNFYFFPNTSLNNPFRTGLIRNFFGWHEILWANTIIYGMFCFPRISYEQKLEKGQSYMLVANHTSMLDIMMMLKTSKNPFVFVGKKELVNIPVFGFFYKRVCILVDREDSRSRSSCI